MLRLVQVHDWIAPLPAAVRAEVQARMRPRRYREGDAIWRIREPATEAYQIRHGKVRLGSESVGGREIVAAMLQPGDCFGETSLIDGLPRRNNAYAVGETSLLVLKKQDFTHLYRTHVEVVHALNVKLCYTLRMALTGIEDASVLTLKQRLARLLARLGYSFGRSDDRGTAIVKDLSHEDLGRMLGVTRQVVSRALKELENEGAIQLRYRQIEIVDLEEFARKYDALVGSETLAPNYRPERA
jgi:CRP-like cAMP-binding protein